MICPKCGSEFAAPDVRSINVAQDPSLKDRVKDGSLFVRRCPRCGAESLAPEPVLYHDPTTQLLIAYTSAGLNSEGLEGYTCRLVSSIGELIEKVKVFDAGLDDIAIELCKYVTAPIAFTVSVCTERREATAGPPTNGRADALGWNVFAPFS